MFRFIFALGLALVLLNLSAPAVFAAVGVNIPLRQPPTTLTRVEPRPTQIGFSISAEPRALLESNLLKRSLTFNYERYSGMLLVNQSVGRFSGFSKPMAVAPNALRDRMIEVQSRRVFVEATKNAQARRGKDEGGGLLEFDIPIKTPKAVKALIGEGGAGLKVTGRYNISFRGQSQWRDGEQVTQGGGKFPSLQMEQVANFQIDGTIGSKIFVSVNQDTKRQETLANRILLRYKGDEDDIIKTIDLGNTSLDIRGTSLTGYSGRVQGLFGIKTTAEVGGLKLTGIASQEKSSNKSASFTAKPQGRIIRDWQYLDNVYFDLRDFVNPTANDLLPGDTITKLEVWVSVRDDQYPNKTKRSAVCYVRPDQDSLAFEPEEKLEGKFFTYGSDRDIPIERQFEIVFYHPTQHYVRFDRNLSSDVTVGLYYEFRRSGQTFSVGSTTNEEKYVFKLLKPTNPQPNLYTWRYVWRNVYDVGRVDDVANFNLSIHKGQAQNPDDNRDADFDTQDGVQYIGLLSLDRTGDGVIEAGDLNILDRFLGHLRFPDREPFASADLHEPTPAIYSAANQVTRQDSSRYYMFISSAARPKQFSLGAFDIVPESEVVTLDGRRLKKGEDYEIQYESGQFTFLNDAALLPNADVKIDYEYSPLIASEKKTLMGLGGEYEPFRNFRLRGAMLYKSEKQTNRKPKLGEEQARFMNLGLSGDYTFETMLPTKLLDGLPLISTQSSSRVSLVGEIARSIPNPNVRGYASIDDFESSLESGPVGILRLGWSPAFALSLQDSLAKPAARLIWFNPLSSRAASDIWNRDAGNVGSSNSVTTMMLQLLESDTTSEPSLFGGGIQRAFSKSSYDQSKIKFIEMRLRGDTNLVLYVDLGTISEDVNRNGVLDAEVTNKTYVTESEDLGIDKLSDEQERELCRTGRAPAWYNCRDSSRSDWDPAGDNWSFDSDANPLDYRRINGTEGNLDDGGRTNRPDTEDLNADGTLVTDSSFFSYRIKLSDPDSSFRVAGSDYKGWFSIRIPFDSSTAARVVGSPSKSNIQFVRLRMESASTSSALEAREIEIAEFELSRNSWEARPMLPERARPKETRFDVSVVNTEADFDVYKRPPFADEETDEITGANLREQSLRFNFFNFAAGDTGFVERVPFRMLDFSGYNRMEMFVHIDPCAEKPESTSVFFRLGPDANNYYEFRDPRTFDSPSCVSPDSLGLGPGWKRWLNVSFDELSQLKLKIPDSATVYEEENFRVVGQPSITRIKYFALGVYRSGSAAGLASGEIWINEMRVTEVRRDRGTAAQASASLLLADFASLQGNYSETDEYYRNLTQSDRRDLGSGARTTQQRFSVSVYAHKLLPASYNAQIPVEYSYSLSRQNPRLLSGSDIVVPDSLRQLHLTQTEQRNFSVRLQRFDKRGRNPIFSLLLNRIKPSYSWGRTSSRSYQQPVNKKTDKTVGASYDISSPMRSGFKLFTWLKGVPLLPDRVANTQINPLPSRFSMTANYVSVEELRQSIKSLRDPTLADPVYRYQRSLRSSIDASAIPITGVDVNYKFSTDRDVSMVDRLKFPYLDNGRERRFSESFGANYSPNIVPFVTGIRLSYQTSYEETFNQTGTDADTSDVRRYSAGRIFSGSATFSLQRLLGQNTGGTRRLPSPAPPKPKAAPSLDSLRRTAAPDTSAAKPAAPKQPGIPVYSYPLRLVRFFTDRIDPISGTVKWDERITEDGYNGRPRLPFRLGFSAYPGEGTAATSLGTSNFDQKSWSRSLTARTKIRLILGISLNTGYAYSVGNATSKQTRDVTETFPDVQFAFGNVNFLQFPKLFARTFTLDSKYSQKRSDAVNVVNGISRAKNISKDWAPLLSAGIDWKFAQGLRSTIGYSRSVVDKVARRDGINENGQISSQTVDYSTALVINTSYSFRGGSKIWLPLFGRMKIQSNLRLNVDINRRKTWSNQLFPTQQDETTSRSEFTVAPSASYDFSNNVKGGLTARWTDSDDKVNGKSHVRSLEFFVNINF